MTEKINNSFWFTANLYSYPEHGVQLGQVVHLLLRLPGVELLLVQGVELHQLRGHGEVTAYNQ